MNIAIKRKAELEREVLKKYGFEPVSEGQRMLNMMYNDIAIAEAMQ